MLGEGRGKDYARILMQLIIYRFQLATFLEPEQVKGMLMGMEYSASGKRLVDLDLFEGKKKYSWGARSEKGEDRAKAGARFRESLMEGAACPRRGGTGQDRERIGRAGAVALFCPAAGLEEVQLLKPRPRTSEASRRFMKALGSLTERWRFRSTVAAGSGRRAGPVAPGG